MPNSNPSINVFTMGMHGGKTWILFKKAMKGFAEAGIISHQAYQSCGGEGPSSSIARLKILLKHAGGYIYAFFWPLSNRTKPSKYLSNGK